MTLNPRIVDWQGRTAWIVGASTGIGRATASKLHALGARVLVSARSAEGLKAFVDQHPGSEAAAVDATDRTALHQTAAALVARHGRLDLAVYCAGTYAPLRATAFDLDVALRHQQVNYVGALYLLDAVLPQLLAQRGGHLSLVSSVAGFRGLPLSLAYGPTKAALTHLAEVLYLDLHGAGIGVSVIHPGFVDTPLTAGNRFAMPALTTPEVAADEILDGWQRGAFEIHFPKRFTRMLKLMRLLPDGLYFRIVGRTTGR